MAENKKSFILYCDIMHTVEKMPNEKAGELFKHILNYVNDKDPITDDLLIQVVFEPIKQQLKRDLKKWEENSLKRSEIGRLGGLKSAEARASKTNQNEAIASNPKQNEHVTVNVTVNDIKENPLSWGDREIDMIYSLYPAKCPKKGTSTGKCSKDKQRIAALLKKKSIPDVRSSIEYYLEEQKKSDRYIMNFKTLLNNLPEVPKEERQVPKGIPWSNDPEQFKAR